MAKQSQKHQQGYAEEIIQFAQDQVDKTEAQTVKIEATGQIVPDSLEAELKRLDYQNRTTKKRMDHPDLGGPFASCVRDGIAGGRARLENILSVFSFCLAG